MNGQFEFHRDKAVDVNHYYFYIDDEDFGPLFIKVCSYAPVEHEVVPQRARMGQTTTGEKERRLSGPVQRVSVLRPAGQTTTDLRLFGAEGNRPGIPQVVEANSAAFEASRPGGDLGRIQPLQTARHGFQNHFLHFHHPLRSAADTC